MIVVGLVVAASAPGQVIDRSPTQILEDPFAMHQEVVGHVVALDDVSLMIANPYGGVLDEGYINSWEKSLWGYQFVERVWPTACHAGPSGTTQSGIGTTGCAFPFTIDVDGDVAAVGSQGGDNITFTSPRGLIHILRRVGGHWVVAQYLRGPANPVGWPQGLDFGRHIALDGGILAVGTGNYHVPGEWQRGAAYIYERGPSGEFELAQFLRAPPDPGIQPSAYGQFGTEIAMHGGMLAVAEPHWLSRVHLYERRASGWELIQTIQRPQQGYFNFGRTMSIDGNSGVLAIREDSGHGMVYVWERDPVTRIWSEVTRLFPMEGSGVSGQPAAFGWSIRAWRDIVAVGAFQGMLQGVRSGCVDIFRRGATGWTRERRIGPPINPFHATEFFGYSIDIADGRLLVGAPGWTATPTFWAGRAYLYELSEGTIACEGPGNTADLHALYDDVGHTRVHLSAFGLTGNGFGYFVAGPPNAGVPFGPGELCVGQPVRVSGPLAFTGSQDRVYADIDHPSPSAPLGTAFQFLYLDRSAPNVTRASIARVVD